MDTDFPLWESSVKSEIRSVVESVQVCREKLGVFDGEESSKVTFAPRGSWPESADRFLVAFEALIYGYDQDEHIRALMKNRRGVDDAFEQKAIK